MYSQQHQAEGWFNKILADPSNAAKAQVVDKYQTEKEQANQSNVLGDIGEKAFEHQEAIDALKKTIDTAANQIFEKTSCAVSIIVGGPEPRFDGQLATWVVHVGQTPSGQIFDDFLPNKDTWNQPFMDFISAAFHRPIQQDTLRKILISSTAAKMHKDRVLSTYLTAAYCEESPLPEFDSPEPKPEATPDASTEMVPKPSLGLNDTLAQGNVAVDGAEMGVDPKPGNEGDTPNADTNRKSNSGACRDVNTMPNPDPSPPSPNPLSVYPTSPFESPMLFKPAAPSNTMANPDPSPQSPIPLSVSPTLPFESPTLSSKSPALSSKSSTLSSESPALSSKSPMLSSEFLTSSLIAPPPPPPPPLSLMVQITTSSSQSNPTAYQCLIKENVGNSWIMILNLWVSFEALNGYPDGAVHANWLPPESWPKEILSWVKYAHQLKTPLFNVNNLKTYTASWREWWTSMQPTPRCSSGTWPPSQADVDLNQALDNVEWALRRIICIRLSQKCLREDDVDSSGHCKQGGLG
ncbi:hypothetical protein PAXINDRAFT_156402 [Paxillus involutus ATCC 200175]|uniref:Uncharacterized protein n=1 Tax=Paxillus involutus ATCC 200175 TaxID=664439 RepID=A0A0C9SW56_PAXIN|nr:hypothetical protein PAXINDRAFT_156402 [Paxillus involutus ATCC 200175]